MFHEMKERAGGKPECPQTGLYDDNRDLGAFWLNFCLQETLLPGKPWHKVLERLEAALAAEMKHQLKDSTRREIVFHLLGQSFVRRYFGCCPGASDLLSSKDTSEINKLEEDAKTWLQDQCFKAAERVHHHFSLDAKGSKRAPEMVRFLNDVYNIVVAETELLLATCEVQHKEKKPQECEADFRVFHRSMGRNPQQSSMAFKRPKSIESKDIHLALLKRTSSQANGEGSQVNGEGAHLYISSSGLSCPESDLLGDLLGAIIARVPGKLSTVCERLVGKLLPRSLRQLIWMSKLLGAGSESCKAKTLAYLEREARVSFGRTVARQVAQLKLRTATRSPVSGLIENAVVEKYGKIPCLSPFATDERMILETSKTLNVLYVFSGTYEPYLIHWLVPLQVAFQQTVPTDEHPYELAMYLHSLHQNLFPSWSKVQATADSVMSFLEREDSTFFSHLRSSFGKNITTDDKDFLVDLILWEQVSTQPMPTVAKELLANPVFFLRNWLAEGFVGVLNLPAVLLVWDQLFMQDWNINAMQSFCASILLLLKDAFMAADDYPAIREVFLMYPSRLLTADIQKAWVHLKQGGLPDDVPGFNSLSQRRLPGEYLNYQDQQFNAN
ncbi:uncharacterized protein LOC125445875 isoform X2 [Sphaerodactylus townsendi]|uniref:uncharacterized protein LOC125445875 isoform X2 n=1 Tax=Sphaerodactylus townsendi TaxID=933632 RepID=UPI002026C5A1|nr:uncharacterized protein LOC125445875 isoform X2 [Sphaerodactylus townsendi]